MADGVFDHPVRISNGRTVVTLASAQEVGSFLLTDFPARRRGRKSYRIAIQACVKVLGGKAEPEVARQALLLALDDMAGKRSRE